jgi:hypothetical protein
VAGARHLWRLRLEAATAVGAAAGSRLLSMMVFSFRVCCGACGLVGEVFRADVVEELAERCHVAAGRVWLIGLAWPGQA